MTDNTRPASWTDAGYAPLDGSDRCRHNMLTAYCWKCDDSPKWGDASDRPPMPEMAAYTPEPLARDTLEADPDTGAWLGLVLLALAFAVGVALGWLLGGVR